MTQFDVVLGVYDKGEGFTQGAQKFLSSNFSNIDLTKFGKQSKWPVGTVRINYASVLGSKHADLNRVAFVGLGSKSAEDEETAAEEEPSYQVKIQQQYEPAMPDDALLRDNARKAASSALQQLIKDDKDSTVRVLVDEFNGFSKEAAEGAVLGSYEYLWKKETILERLETAVKIEPLDENAESSSNFRTGVIYATGQVIAAALEETPANLLTPTVFCDLLKQKYELLNRKNVTVNIYDRKWASEKGMGSFLSVTQGSDEEPKVLEITYKGRKQESSEIDLFLIGKGITFDSGGYSLKPSEAMKIMKGDMGGAATVVASLYAAIQLDLPLNIVGLTFMCENLINGKATKPGDVITAMNKKKIEVDNTDAEGRLILADALCYASAMKPKVMIDIATLTGAMIISLGGAAAGVFTNSTPLWKVLQDAGIKNNEYLWRMPLFKDIYLKQMKSNVSDINNIGGREGGSCTAASFLSEFVNFKTVKHWAHIDIASVALPGFSRNEMTGRPTRAIVEFMNLYSKNPESAIP